MTGAWWEKHAHRAGQALYSVSKRLWPQAYRMQHVEHWAEYRRRIASYLTDVTGMFSAHYDSASTDRLHGDWSTNYGTHYDNLRDSWKTIVARAIKAIDNYPHAAGLQTSILGNVIGTGIRPRPNVQTKDGKSVEGVNKALEEGWKRYNDQWDAKQGASFVGKQRLMLSEIMKTGTCLTNKVRAPRENYLGVQSQVVHLLRLDDSHDRDDISLEEGLKGSQTVFGVNIDENGAPVSYWIQGVKRPVSATVMHASYREDSSEQYLGNSWYTQALKFLWGNEQLMKDTIVASRIQNMVMLLVPNAIAGNLIRNNRNTNDNVEWEPGKVWQYDPKSGKPEVISTSQNVKDVLNPLQKLMLQGIGASMGHSYQTFTRDTGDMSFSSMRGNTIEDRRIYRVIQAFFIETCLQWEWDYFVGRMFLEGHMGSAGMNDYMRDPWHYNRAMWRTDGWDWVDPLKDANANIALVNNRMLSLERFYAERYGADWREELRQISDEEEELKTLGLDRTKEQAQGNTDEEDEQKERDERAARG